MKRIFTTLAVVAALTFSSGAFAFWCSAASPSAYGYGVSTISIDHACGIAVNECVIRTPHWQVCTITGYGL